MKPYVKVEEPEPVRVLLPFTKPTVKLQLVIDCLRAQQVQPELVRVGDDERYWTLLHDAWDAGETFYVVEQDVVVWHGGIHELEDCGEDWCTLPTMCHGRMIPTTFGCVKFSKRLIERNPRFWDSIETTWFHLDRNFADKMGWPFIKPHTHSPVATHLNEAQWSDEISTRYTLERKVVWQMMEAGEQAARVQYRTTEDDEGLPWWRRRKGTRIGVAKFDDE